MQPLLRPAACAALCLGIALTAPRAHGVGAPVFDATAKADNVGLLMKAKMILIEAGLMETLLQDGVRAIGDPEFRKNYLKNAGLSIAGVYGVNEGHINMYQGIKEGDWEKAALGFAASGLMPTLNDPGRDLGKCEKKWLADNKNQLPVKPTKPPKITRGSSDSAKAAYKKVADRYKKEAKEYKKKKRDIERKASQYCTSQIQLDRDTDQTCGGIHVRQFKPEKLGKDELNEYNRMNKKQKKAFDDSRAAKQKNDFKKAKDKCENRVRERHNERLKSDENACRSQHFVERTEVETALYNQMDPKQRKASDADRRRKQEQGYQVCRNTKIYNTRKNMVDGARQANKNAVQGLINVGKAIDSGNWDEIDPDEILDGVSTLGIRKPEDPYAEKSAARILKRILQDPGEVDRKDYERFLKDLEQAGHGQPDTTREKLEAWGKRWSKEKLQQAKDRFRRTNKEMEDSEEETKTVAQGDYPPKSETAKNVENALPGAQGQDLSDPNVTRDLAYNHLFIGPESEDNAAEAIALSERRSKLTQTAAIDAWTTGIASTEAIEKTAAQTEQLSSALSQSNSLREDMAVLVQASLVGIKQNAELSALQGQGLMLDSMETINTAPAKLPEGAKPQKPPKKTKETPGQKAERLKKTLEGGGRPRETS